MNIVFLVSSMGSGGAERVAATLCNAWAARGDHVTLIATYSGRGDCFYPLSEQVEMLHLADLVLRRHRNTASLWERLRVLRREIVNRQPDVVVSFLPNVNIAALLATVGTSVPVLIGERSDPLAHPQRPLMRWACKLGYRFADALVVQTRAVEQRIGGLYPPPGVLRAIPNPLPEGVETTVHVGSGSSRPTLISVGRLSAEKQVDLMIRAFAQVAARRPEWDYHLYGEGPLRDAIQSQIDAAGLSDRIRLMGRTTEPWQVMARSDAFLMASRYEGFPNALLEAMGVGLPCVVTDCPSGPREITREGQDALLAPNDDEGALASELDRLLGDAALRSELGGRARTSVRARYGLDSVLAQWDSVMEAAGVTR